MDLVAHVTESYEDVIKRFQGRMLTRDRRKVRRGDKMQKFQDRLDPMDRLKDRPSAKLAVDRTGGLLEKNRAS